jgi:hypothetical protein
VAESTDISDALFEQCLRAFHKAPADFPSLDTLTDLTDNLEGFRRALRVAYAAGGMAALEVELTEALTFNQKQAEKLADRDDRIRKLEAMSRAAMRMIEDAREYLTSVTDVLNAMPEVPDVKE